MEIVTSGGETTGSEGPLSVESKQNYPNPFNPRTVISYELPVGGYVAFVEEKKATSLFMEI